MPKQTDAGNHPSSFPFSNPPDYADADNPFGIIGCDNNEIPNTDDTPTVLSKNKPLPFLMGKSGEGPLTDLSGRTLAHFELQAPIGVGGMAAVIRARDTQLDRIVALKILPPDMAAESDNVLRFQQEARAAARLDHENIARVFYCGEDQGLSFIAFEFVEGKNLKTILDQNGPLPPDLAIRCMIDVAEGLVHASQRGVVHRDIKPSNIIVTAGGKAKLVDMGLARSHERSESKDLTQSGVTLGTFEYISPEQALEPRLADVRSDIYSLGCTFYHLLTGVPPVPDGTAAKKLNHHQHVQPVDPRQLNPSIPDSLAAILSKMMAKLPGDRYPQAEHLVQDLLAVAHELGAAEGLSRDVRTVAIPPPPRKPTGILFVAGLTALVAVIVFLSLAGSGFDLGRKVIVERPKFKPDPPNRRNAKIAGAKSIRPVPPAISEPIYVSSEKELIEAPRQLKGDAQIVLTKDFELQKSLALTGAAADSLQAPQRLILRAKDPKNPVTITIKVPAIAAGNAWAAVRIQGATVEFHNINFEIQFEQAQLSRFSAIEVEAGKLTCYGCRFTQTPAISDAALVASVRVRNKDGEALSWPSAHFTECLFAQGRSAIATEGAVVVSHTNCAFGPHQTLFRVFGNNEDNVVVNLKQCSAFVIDGPVVRLDGQPNLHLNAQECLFSDPDFYPNLGPKNSFVVQSANPQKQLVSYSGKQNVFHGLRWFWSAAGADENPAAKLATLTEFRERFSAQTVENSSHQLSDNKNPWQSDNPKNLFLANDSQPQLAFRVKENLRELRRIQDGRFLRQPIGVSKFAGADVYDGPMKDLPPLPQPPVVADAKFIRKFRLKDTANEWIEKGYTKLNAALSEAQAGDRIYINSDDVIRIRAVELNAKQKDILVKPQDGRRPTLTLDGEGSEAHGRLFKINGGEITFENLNFHLLPDRAGFDSQSIVTLVGGGRCLFRKCRFTLQMAEREEFYASLHVASLPVSAKKMAMPEARIMLPSHISFEGCFARGVGSLLAVRHTTPFHLAVTDSLVALNGSLLEFDGTLTKPMDAEAVVELKRTTTYLLEHLFLLDQQDGKLLIPMKTRSNDCLYLAARSEPLIYVKGAASQKKAEEWIFWEGDRNAYCGYGKIFSGKLSNDEGFKGLTPLDWQMKVSGGAVGRSRSLKSSLILAPLFHQLRLEEFIAGIPKVSDADRMPNHEPLSAFGVRLVPLRDGLPPAPTTRTMMNERPLPSGE